MLIGEPWSGLVVPVSQYDARRRTKRADGSWVVWSAWEFREQTIWVGDGLGGNHNVNGSSRSGR